MKRMNAKPTAKLRKNAGFTLVEMLIVVAIIAILIAVSIPLVQTALEKSRDATDQANERAAKAEAALVYLGGTNLDEGELELIRNGETTLYYEAESGKLLEKRDWPTTAKPYGKCTGCGSEYGEKNDGESHTNYIITLVFKKDGTGEVDMKWDNMPK